MSLYEQLRRAVELGAVVELTVNAFAMPGGVTVLRTGPSKFQLIFSSSAELLVFRDGLLEAGLQLEQHPTAPNGATLASLALRLRT